MWTQIPNGLNIQNDDFCYIQWNHFFFLSFCSQYWKQNKYKKSLNRTDEKFSYISFLFRVRCISHLVNKINKNKREKRIKINNDKRRTKN